MDANAINTTTDVTNQQGQEYSSPMLLKWQSCDKWMQDAACLPDATPLYPALWNQGEVSCLFADSNLGKSIFAVQIAEHISKSQKVLYCDCELTAKQFQQRYTIGYQMHGFNPNFIRCEVDVTGFDGNDFETQFLMSIERLALDEHIKVIIIDNLTWLCNQSENGDAAGALMQRLMLMKKVYGWSILVIAHTPKRDMRQPITQNDLAGSKRLFNFFDSVFAIGLSAQDNNLRYVKQLKVRTGEFVYDAESVDVCQIEREGAMLMFKSIGQARESQHLHSRNDKEKEALKCRAKQMAAEGMSVREISAKLGISKSTAHNYIAS